MNVLAFEADHTQTEGIRHVVCDLVGARLTVAASLDQLLYALRQATPDLVLLPALVSPSQESVLVEALRALPDAAHVETLITPVLPPRAAAAAPQGWRRWTSRHASTSPMTSAESGAFAERVHWALERAYERRAHATRDDVRNEHEEPAPPAMEPPVDLAPATTARVEPVMLALEIPSIVSAEAPSSLLQLLDNFVPAQVTGPEDLELADATSRLLKKLNRSEADRRQYRRFAARELPGLRSARIKFGPDVDLVDVSAGGALFETTSRLQPESEALLELVGSENQAVVPFRILRCQIAAIQGKPRYLGACVFKQPLDLDELAWAAAGSVEASRGLTLVPARAAVRNAW